MPSSNRILAVVTLLVALELAVRPGPPARAADGPIAFPKSELTIVTDDGARHTFSIEVARTPAQHRRGLMYRRELAKDHGMLFIYDPVRAVSMWMKNTHIPLDMLFIEPAGRISRIHERATPETTTPIPSGGAVKAVLELRGGTVDRLGIETGDMVEHAALGER